MFIQQHNDRPNSIPVQFCLIRRWTIPVIVRWNGSRTPSVVLEPVLLPFCKSCGSAVCSGLFVGLFIGEDLEREYVQYARPLQAYLTCRTYVAVQDNGPFTNGVWVRPHRSQSAPPRLPTGLLYFQQLINYRLRPFLNLF